MKHEPNVHPNSAPAASQDESVVRYINLKLAALGQPTTHDSQQHQHQ